MLRRVALQPADLDDAVRAAAFAWLNDAREGSGGLVTRTELEAFEFQGRRGKRPPDRPERDRHVRDPSSSLRRERPRRAAGLQGGDPR
jgi:hypothetical protein